MFKLYISNAYIYVLFNSNIVVSIVPFILYKYTIESLIMIVDLYKSRLMFTNKTIEFEIYIVILF
jgi:hypothetical protein